MRKNTFFGKIFTEFLPVAAVVMFSVFGLRAEDGTLTDSLKDDVTAMITSAKKMPHQIFIVDSSESMNSFAYSDYVDTCRDSNSNMQKAINLCNNAYTQCRNVESNAMCDVNLNCGDIKSKCDKLGEKKSILEAQCTIITTQRFPEPGIFERVDDYDDARAKKYVGPWNPKYFYNEDICFFDWASDNNADSISAELDKEHYHGAAEEYNKKELCKSNNIATEQCDSWFNDKYGSKGEPIVDRSDWDCLTDGSGHFLPKSGYSWQDIKNGRYTGKDSRGEYGISGLWLNWKYATSLDALKIILADTHQFSFQPRKRGDDNCYKTNYYARQTYQETKLCTQADVDAEALPDSEKHGCSNVNDAYLDSTGQAVMEDRTACFIVFDPSLSDVSGSNREAMFEALRAAVDETWDSEQKATPDSSDKPITEDDAKDPKNLSLDQCRKSLTETFSRFDSADDAPKNSNVNDCDKCMMWKKNSDGSGSFVESECKSYNIDSSSGSAHSDDLGEKINIELKKECCKTFSCTNPKCRDNDLCCKNNVSAYPAPADGEDESEGYKKCVKGEEYKCALGFYSEFDQDTSHCCGDLVCSEAGDKTTYPDPNNSSATCDLCETGAAMGSDTGEGTTGVVPILVLENPGTDNAYCGPGSTEGSCNDIPITVGIKSGDAVSIPFGDVSSVTVTVYYDCVGSADEHPTNLLGSGSCVAASSEDDCTELVSGELTGCSTVGYRMEAKVEVSRRSCHFDKLNLNFNIAYSFGEDAYTVGSYQNRTVFDKSTPIFHTYNMETSATLDKVIEYECKTSFYSRQTITRSGSSCPTANQAPSYINQVNQGDKIEYCEARTAEREVLARDQWGTATQVACSWLCRAAVTYDEPWKCASYFFMMDDVERNGSGECDDKCYKATNDNLKLAECCKCINGTQSQYLHHETPSKVDMIDPVTHNRTKYTCSVSSYLYATASNGTRTTSSGSQAEIINGHIDEGGTPGYYLLSPYGFDDDKKTYWTPYTTFGNPDDVGTGGWYKNYSLINSEDGQKYLGDTLTSLFTTGDHPLNQRKPVCIYDLLWGWNATDCDSNCTGGCCSIDISQDSDDCAKPAFWMKVPDGDGGRILMDARELSDSDNAKLFRQKIKGLRAVGASTLGETLYDVWRYLGGMRALYDRSVYTTKVDDPENPGGEQIDKEIDLSSKTYISPYAAQDPQCFTNEAVIISGGNPQFDSNYKLKTNEKTDGVASSCPTFVPKYEEGKKPANTVAPCVEDEPETLTQFNPYLKDQWQRTSLFNVARFVNRNTFWGKEECRNPKKPVSDDDSDETDDSDDDLPPELTGEGRFAKGDCEDDSDANDNCCGNDPAGDGDAVVGADEADIPVNVPVIDRVHTIAIGEWGLSMMYRELTGSAATYLDESMIKQVAESTWHGKDDKGKPLRGRYYTLTASGSGSGTSGGGSFNDLTSLFVNFVHQSKETDVVVGRPHWTSSLVQPFDVEEKYRGPDAYVAGAVPVDGSVSRFWFGNLKQYHIDGKAEDGDQCPISDDTKSECGAWKRQGFDVKDCFGLDDVADGQNSEFGAYEGGKDDLKQYQKLMVGGAAYRLAEKLGSGSGSYQNTPRTIYTDRNESMVLLSSLSSSQLSIEMKKQTTDNSFDATTVEKIFSYMAGYDAFDDDGDGDSTNVRYSEPWFKPSEGSEKTKSFEVDNPFDVDFGHKKKLTLRPLLLGAIVHSKPVAVYYEDASHTRIYVGANDGMLHAFDESGEEVYAYVPTLAYQSISKFAGNTTTYKYNTNIFFNATVDGPITMMHIDKSHDGIINSGEKAYLIFGYRRGAKGYTVIDVSDPNKPKFVQNLNTDGGFSFGKVAVFRKCNKVTCSYADELDYYLAVPGGYDTCHDPSALTKSMADNIPVCSQSELLGNKFTIYKFNKSTGGFDNPREFSADPGSPLGAFEKSWLVTSFTSVPLVVNTSGKAAVNTEFVYFTDLSGTVFRVDVRDNLMSNWTAKVVFTNRNGDPGPDLKKINWGDIGRSFVSSNFFPPLERYNPSRTLDGSEGDWLIPIPVITGNAANPRFIKQEGIRIFYDKKDGDNTPLYTTDFLNNVKGKSHSIEEGATDTEEGATNTATNTMITGKRGWQVDFARDNGEKGITEPLIVYDIYGSDDFVNKNSYSIAWNTYIPMKSTECKTYGTSSNYERYLPDGEQAFSEETLTGDRGEWTLSADSSGECVAKDTNLSLATGVGVVASDSGYDLTFGAGAEIFRKPHITVKRNKTYIIKWYELY